VIFFDGQPYSRFVPTHAHCQAAAAARIVDKFDVVDAAGCGNFELVKDHVVADAGCVHKTGGLGYDCPLQLRSIFLISVIRGDTALMLSSMSGHLEITRFLVESGANVEARSNEYSAPKDMIFQTARALQLRSIFLISVVSGDTALMLSSEKGQLATTRFLVESGANVEAKNNEYPAPKDMIFQTACTLQLRSIFLISVISGWTALMLSLLSSEKGQLATTRFLVESKADVAARNK
jgi:ankyrin repeat protein